MGDTWRGVETSTRTGETDPGVTVRWHYIFPKRWFTLLFNLLCLHMLSLLKINAVDSERTLLFLLSLYMSFVYHGAVNYCHNVRWCVWVPVLCVWAFVPLWIAQMITGLVPCDNHCALVLSIQGAPCSFVWVSTLCFCYLFVWSSSRAFTEHDVIWCVINK
jgi:hypothetical protein